MLDRLLVLATVAIVAVVAGLIVEVEWKKQHETTYFSNTPLNDQISYCWFRGNYTVNHGRHKGERWYKEGYLPCYFIPYRTEV